MQILNYLQSILPSFTKSRILEDVNFLREELQDETIPPLKSFASAFGTHKFKNEWVKTFDQDFRTKTGLKYSGNFIVALYQVCENVMENLPVIDGMINRYFENDILRDAMPVLNANVMQYLETAGFMTRYIQRLMIAAISLEINTIRIENKDVIQTNELPSEGEMNWLGEFRPHFFAAVEILSDKKEALEEKFKEIPENMVINTNTAAYALQSVGAVALDPLNFGFIPVKLNPIFHIRMKVADYQIARFNAAKAQRQMLQYKLLRMKLAQEKKTDAALERNIAMTADRIDRLNYQIMEMEKDYVGAS